MTVEFTENFMLAPGEVYERGATLSDDGVYRYTLTRRWSDIESSYVLWIMLNPSTADALKDDPTIRKIVGMSKRWGYGGLTVVNLFAFRTYSPKAMELMANARVDIVGAQNVQHVAVELAKAGGDENIIVAAWGNGINRWLMMQAKDRIRPYIDREVQCLGYTAALEPRHPCRLAYDTPLVRYRL